MGELIRQHDWANTPLGPIETWSQSLRTIVDLMLNARQPVYIAWGPSLTSLYNEDYIPILGTKHPEALGKPYQELWAEVWEEYRPIVEATMAGEAQHFVDRPVALAGRAGRPMSWFTFSWIPLRGEADSDAGFFCVATETTEKVRAEEDLRASQQAALRASEERYRTLFQSIDEGFCVLQLIFDENERPTDFRYIEINPAFERQTGMQEAAGKTIRELLPEVEPFWFDTFGRVALTGQATRFIDHAKSLGRWFDVYAFRTGEPHERHVAAIFSDITERKRSEEALRESEERFRLMADAIPQIIWITDPAGRVEFFNRQWTLYTGAPYESITAGEVAASFVHPDDAAATMAAFDAARNAGGVFQIEHRIRSQAGEYRWFLVRAEPYRDPRTGRIVRWFGASMDIHDRRLAEEARQASESRATLLLAELQHRVRNTLSVLRSIARRTATTSDTVEDYAAHLDGRIDAFARVQAAVTRNPIAGLDLEQLVADEFLAHAAHEGEQVESIAGPKLLLRPKAAESIALAIHELATNAVKYGALASKQGRISVRWKIENAETERRLVIEWIETGVKLSGDGPRRRGFGTELIERILTYELGGEAGFRFDPQGLRCTISLPVDDHLLVERRGSA